jgi:signal transduction histidine kinase
MKYGSLSLADNNQPVNYLETRPACLIDGLSPRERDRERIQALEQLDLLTASTVTVFEEAAQTVSRMLAVPICVLSVLDRERQLFKATMGLSSLGLMNQLASTRELPRQESFCTHVVESGQTLILNDTTQHPAFAKSLLVQQYGIQAYLGVPLITSGGCCIGTLAVMDLLPRQFTPQEVAILELNARWSISEYEKQRMLTQQRQTGQGGEAAISTEEQMQLKVNSIRLGLISQLTQDLRSPLTSITGMASMLSREIYGSLTEKQHEYAKIVLDSSQEMLALVSEIVELGESQEALKQLTPVPVDIEMLGQQSLQGLEKFAKQRELVLSLTVEPGSRVWVLDKRVVKQMLYHLVFSLIQLAATGSTIRIHVSRRDDCLNIATWVSNPWLGEDLPQAIVAWEQRQSAAASQGADAGSKPEIHPMDALLSNFEAAPAPAPEAEPPENTSRQELGLLLSRYLVDMHAGSAAIQGSLDTGYRYVISLPSLKAR